jgi:hypothetical protein
MCADARTKETWKIDLREEYRCGWPKNSSRSERPSVCLKGELRSGLKIKTPAFASREAAFRIMSMERARRRRWSFTLTPSWRIFPWKCWQTTTLICPAQTNSILMSGGGPRNQHEKTRNIDSFCGLPLVRAEGLCPSGRRVTLEFPRGYAPGNPPILAALPPINCRWL